MVGDGGVRGGRADALARSCKAPPDLTVDPARLADLRASDDALNLMRARGARHVVVVEVRATLGCLSGSSTTLLAHYGVGTLRSTSSFPGDDMCDSLEIQLSAFVFGADGAAVWAGTREIEAGEPVEPAVEKLFQRVPVTMPKSGRKRASNADLRCHVNDRGVIDCT